MNILFFGDVVGKSGFIGLSKFLDKYKKTNKIDFIFANGENASNGRGFDRTSYNEGKKIGIDGFTLGNHSFDKKDIIKLLKEFQNIIRPLNYPKGIPGKGYYIFSKNNHKVALINLCCRIFMKPLDCPFKRIEEILNDIRKETNIIIVDIHGESTSEKKALGFFLDGKVTAVIGTHTHTQTSDIQILNKGTLFITDVGMVGAKNSILGCKKENIINHFLTGLPFKLEIESEGVIQINGIEIILDNNNLLESFSIINTLI